MINDIYNRKILGFAADIPRLQRLASPDATAVAQQDAIINQDINADATATTNQTSDINQ